MSEKTPLEMLNEIHSMLSTLTSKVNMLEQNVALLHDKANGKLFPDIKFQAGKAISVPTPKVASPKIMGDLEAAQGQIGIPLEQKVRDGITRVHGAVFSPDKKPMHGVTVLIKSQKSDNTVQLKTNLNGEWETELGPGKYAITYTKEKMSAIYRFVEVKPGQQEVKVV